MTKTLIASLFAAVALATALPARAQSETAIAVPDYTVFVDPPTGFAFVKLPAGWKFVGKLDAADVARLPAGVVTALLKSDAEPVLADGASTRPAARPTQMR